MARNTPPTLTSYTETASWATVGATKSVTVSWSTGDQIVVIGGCEAVVTLGVPTATGLTFTSRFVTPGTGSQCSSRGATAPAAAPGTSVSISMTNTSSTTFWGFGVWVITGSDGFDATIEQHTSTKTASLTHTDTHSATAWGAFDFSAAATTGVTLSPAATHTRQLAANAQYTVYVGDLADHAASGAQAYGITGGSSTGPFSIGAIAMLGTTVAGSSIPDVVMAPPHR